MSTSPAPGTASGKSRVLAGGLVLALLIAGGAIGVSVDRLWVRGAAEPEARHWKHKKHHSTEQIVARFREQVSLTDEQVLKVTEIIERTKKRARAHHIKMKPMMRKAHEQAHKEILAILRGDQIAQYEKMIAKKKKRHHHKMHKMHNIHKRH